jgi:hypothetical protein
MMDDALYVRFAVSVQRTQTILEFPAFSLNAIYNEPNIL